MRRSSVLAAASVAMCLVAPACSGSSAGHDERKTHFAHDATFTMAIWDDFGPIDPYRSGSLGIDKLAYDSLLNLRPSGEFVSGLAEKWTADATSASFTLRPNVTCSDGTPLTAAQVAADLRYLGDPANGSPQYGTLIPTVPFTVTADDSSRTVKVLMRRPFGFLLNTVGQVPIMCAKGLRNPKLLAGGSDGTGPFVLTNVVAGQSYTFKVRKDYTWGPASAGTSAPGTPAKIVVRVILNETTAANLMLSDEVNYSRILDEGNQRRLSAQGLTKFERSASGGWLWLNQLGGRPTADKKVRQALVEALDLPNVIKINTGGHGRAATGLVNVAPRSCPGDTVAGKLPKRDIAAAGSLLDGAGWIKGAGGVRRKNGKPLTLDLDYRTDVSSYDKATAEFLAQQWKAIGVQVKLTGGTFGQGLHVFDTANYDVFTLGLAFFLPSQVVPYMSGTVPPHGTNIAGIDNKNYNDLAAKASAITPPAACPYWNQAEQALFTDFDVVPIATRPDTYFLHNAQAQMAAYDDPIPTSIRVLD
jgi:peptide/nickel transport system substrate-binding protein